MKNTTSIRLLLAGLIALPAAASAAPLVTPTLSGNTEYEGWEELTAANNPGYPGFFNFTDPWPAPIDPNISGSAGNAGFDKVSGGGYPASESIYSFTAPGTFAVTNTAPLVNLETVTFQLDLGVDSFLASPVLSYNGGSQNLSATFSEQGAGPTAFTNPQTGEEGTTTLFGFQWDLSSIAGPVTDYTIQWTTDAHATVYNLRLDSSDSFTGNAVSAVPEPSALLLVAIGGLLLLFLRTRNRRSLARVRV